MPILLAWTRNEQIHLLFGGKKTNFNPLRSTLDLSSWSNSILFVHLFIFTLNKQQLTQMALIKAESNDNCCHADCSTERQCKHFSRHAK